MADHLTLTRHFMVNIKPNSLAEHKAACRSEVVTGFPPVPATALPLLRLHLTGRARRGDDGRITWHHSDAGAWAAVLGLLRNGDDPAALQLAEFLRWCEARGQHADNTMWALAADTDTGSEG